MSSKGQVVIPKELRDRACLKAGQEFMVHESSGVVFLVPVVPMGSLRGKLKGKGVSSSGIRDKSGKDDDLK